jgi:hypothetical protein
MLAYSNTAIQQCTEFDKQKSSNCVDEDYHVKFALRAGSASLLLSRLHSTVALKHAVRYSPNNRKWTESHKVLLA